MNSTLIIYYFITFIIKFLCININSLDDICKYLSILTKNSRLSCSICRIFILQNSDFQTTDKYSTITVQSKSMLYTISNYGLNKAKRESLSDMNRFVLSFSCDITERFVCFVIKF